MFPGAARLDHHAHAVAVWKVGYGLHRRAEVGHVQTAAQVVGQRRAQELHHQALALLADVHAHLSAGQVDDHAAGAIGAAAEVDVAQRQQVGVLAAREMRRLRGRGEWQRCRRPLEHHQQRLALQLGAVAGRPA